VRQRQLVEVQQFIFNMKRYIVLDGYAYEGNTIIGIFSSKENANEVFDKLKKKIELKDGKGIEGIPEGTCVRKCKFKYSHYLQIMVFKVYRWAL
jgi:hypothetical protein